MLCSLCFSCSVSSRQKKTHILSVVKVKKNETLTEFPQPPLSRAFVYDRQNFCVDVIVFSPTQRI